MGLLLLDMFTMAFSMLAKRLSSTVLTAPMLFIGFGVLLAETGLMSHEGAEIVRIVPLAASKHDPEVTKPVLLLATNAVWISALQHGTSAAPGGRWHAARVNDMGECAKMEPIEASAKPFKSQPARDKQNQPTGEPT